MKNVIITIKGEQFAAFYDKDSVEFTTEGQLVQTAPGNYVLTYTESEMTGINGTTQISIEPSRMVISRRGEVVTEMVFDPYQKKLCHYDTGYGVFEMGISTRNFSQNFGIGGGDLSLSYTLEINNQIATENKIHINVREADRHNVQS